MKKVLILLVMLMFFPFVKAAYYVNSESCSTGAGGTNWNDAICSLDDFPYLIRGETYYIADGTYGGYVFDDEELGEDYIIIKKATPLEHGTDVGWVDSYGDGQALWNGYVMFVRGYYIFNGSTGGGPSSWKSGYGFKFPSFEGVKIYLANPTLVPEDMVNISNIIISHVEMEGVYPGVPGRSRGIDATASNSFKSNITISHCYIHDESLPFYFILSLIHI